jgi:hypothetical protein
MLPSDRERLEVWFSSRAQRRRAVHDLVAEQLLRSYQQIVASRQLLSIKTPNIWRPEPRVIEMSPLPAQSPDASCSSP